MYFSLWSLCLVSGLSLSIGVGAAPPTSLSERRRGEHDTHQQSTERADAVKEAFQFAWDGYYKYAFSHDELRPVTNSYANSRNGWGATAVDSLSTALVMEIPVIVNQIVDYIPTIDFSKTDEEVSLFETTIRYLGGMLSGYDLLKGPLSHLVKENNNVESLLAQSKALADVLKYAFDTPSGVPVNTLRIGNQTTDGSTTNGLATIGTLVLEWTRLSDLLGNDEYAKLSQKGQSYLMAPKPARGEPFPGLVGTNVDVNTGLFRDGNGGWGGGDDSFYEYLLKMYVYDPSRFGDYKERWIVAADSTMKYLTTHPEPRPDLTFVANFASTDLSLNGGHLTCFHGGNFLLGGSVLNRRDYTDYGLSLVASCHSLYTATLTHIGPESYSWDSTNVPKIQKEFFKKNGFYITNSQYILRPEVIESYYYAYQVTKEQKYRDWAWDAFVAINATTRAASGFSSVTDVNAADGGRKTDNQESFLFAEVMKYSYLIHAEDNVWQVDGNGQSEFVFNTEAHPFKVQGLIPGHGSGN